MSEENKTTEQGLRVILSEEIKTTAELKTFIDNSTAPISINNIESAKELASSFASKYSGLQVTTENYKTVAKDAERETREFCVLLRKLDKRNATIHSQAREVESSNVKELISIIEPVQKCLKDGIDTIANEEKAKREAKKKAEEEAKQKIKDSIADEKNKLSSFVRNCEGDISEIVEYNSMINEFQERIDSKEFCEFTIIAERDIAIATGERRIIETAIENKKLKLLQSELEFIGQCQLCLSDLIVRSDKESIVKFKEIVDSLTIKSNECQEETKERINKVLEDCPKKLEELEKSVQKKEKEIEEERAFFFTKIYTEEMDKIMSSEHSTESMNRFKLLLDKIDCNFDTFSDYEFKRLDIHDKYKLHFDLYCNELRELTEKKTKDEQEKRIILNSRRAQLIEIGFKELEDCLACDHYQPVTNKEILSYSEVDWLQGIKFIKGKIEESKQNAVKEEQEKIENVKKSWTVIVSQIKELGGNTKKFEKIGIPNSEDLDNAHKYTQRLRDEAEKKKIEEIASDLKQFKENSNKMLELYSEAIETAEFKQEESKEILLQYLSKLIEATEETFQ